jgi:ribosomal protein S18 acetylase RimI-like enzyme
MPDAVTPAVSFRIAGCADALCIGVLATQVFLDTYAPDGIRPSLADEVLEHFSTDATAALLRNPATTFIVAEAAGHLVGFVQLTHGATHTLLREGPAVELDRLYVLARFGGRGIGTLLLRRAEAVAAQQRASMMWLTAWVGNHHALGFYARRGYRDVGATVYRFQDEQYENRVLTRALVAPAAAATGK